MRIDSCMHADMTDGAPLVCSTCGVKQTIEETTQDPLMYTEDYEHVECDGCRECRMDWPQEVAMTRWEEAQR